VAQAAALAAIDDREHVRRSIESNRAGLAQLSAGLQKLGVKYVPSFTNFLLVDFGFETEPLSDQMLKRSVIVRPMRWMGFPNCIRVSVGAREENEKFLQVLAELHASQHHNSHKPQKRH
jgi:histidinol-phosphate aminotransferase